MKKILMIAAMMVATVAAKAQFEPGTFSLQPKIGSTLSKVSNMPRFGEGQYSLDRSLYPGFVIGGEAEYQLTKAFSLAAGLNFAMQGCQWEDTDFKIDGKKVEVEDTKLELGYITLPIVANIYLFKGFAIKGGVQLGYLVSANFKNTQKMDGQKTSLDRDIKDNCNKFDISIPVGVSYQVPTIPIYIDGRFNIGLSDIVKKEYMDAGDKNCKNQVFQLTVGYKFAL
jgi:hypothetical protein